MLVDQLTVLGAELPPARAAEISRLCAAVDLDFLRSDLPSLVGEVQSGLKQMQYVVSSLRDVMRPGEPELQRINLVQSLEGALAMLHGRFSPNLTIERDYVDAAAWVECAPAELGQVLLALLQNAVQATALSGTINLNLTSTADDIKLKVSDSGVGIAPENLPHIFDPFFTTRAVGEGKGLGLYIAARITREYGGTLTVDSRLGQGSCFTLILPRVRKPGDSS